MKKILYTIYLKHDLACNSLESSAIAQLIIKILYSQNKKISINEISTNLCKIVGSKISDEKIITAIGEISSKISISQNNSLFKLRDSYRENLNFRYKERDDRFDRIIVKYFDNCVSSTENIKNWFNEVLIEYFCNFSSDWIKNVSKKNFKTDITNIEDILNNKKILNNNHIDNSDKKWLVKQLKIFLTCNESDEATLLWDYGNSMFAAKLLYSKEYIDKSVIDLFKNMTLILDTNILMHLYLENDMYSDSYIALEKIFEKLDISLAYFHITHEEFINAINNKIEKIKKLLETYDYRFELFSQVDDAFIQTAIGRNCKNEDDFEVFFESVKDVPNFFSENLPIKIIDNKEINSIIQKGKDNNEIKKNLNDIFKKKFNYNKSHYNLEHDAGIIKGAQFLNNTSKTIILSRDSTIIEYANLHIIRDNLPIVISLDTLLNVFAINDGFEGVVESNFIPLFAHLVKTSIYSCDKSFTIEDLLYLKDIESRIDNLTDEQLIEIASEVNKKRLKGEDASKIALQIKRSFVKYDNALSMSEETQKDKQIKEYKNKNIVLRKKFFTNKRKVLKNEYIKERNKYITYVIGGCLILLVFAFFLINNNFNNKLFRIVTFLSTLIGELLISSLLAFPKIMKTYKTSISGIEDEINHQWKEFISIEQYS